MKATVINVFDEQGNEIKNVSIEIVLNGETYVKKEVDKQPENSNTKPIWETCRETMWDYDSENEIETIGYVELKQDESLRKLNKHLNALAYLSEIARRCNGDRVVDWTDIGKAKFHVRRYQNTIEKDWAYNDFKRIAFLDKEARDHSFKVDKHIWNDYYGLPNE